MDPSTFALVAFVLALALAGANGANDNLKGVATLLGSGVMGFRQALTLASLATAAGSLASIFLADALLTAFGGRGLLPDVVAQSPAFLLAVSGGAALTVALATALAMPISTTHALVGALVGAGLALAPAQLDLAALGKQFIAPLLLAPLLAIPLGAGLRALLQRLTASDQACVCRTPEQLLPTASGNAMATPAALVVADREDARCRAPAETLVALPVHRWRDALHTFSALAVSFARGLNDTPKMAAILVLSGSSGKAAALWIALAMTAGGVLAAWRVARTMAWRITPLNPSDGLAANLSTSALVFAASPLGLPVSTTQVACGALFGIATGNRRGDGRMIALIALAWLLTLPCAALASAAIALTLHTP
ncbi:MAG: inorganic phosphate transporter [Xanthomonadales bacterium]|jgi:PiT family inorganic phosphate transporter|nr:inorganic phosphate transporter [Xanthomonadales bacterium]